VLPATGCYQFLLVALEKLGAPPGVSSVMVGDSVWDVEAAKRAA
jgi:phosphoglycolate phosphatase-like HAD superfamily hydrolase